MTEKHIHQGIFTFNTEKRLERSYIDDIEREIAKSITKFLKDNGFKHAKKEFSMVTVQYNILASELDL